MRNLSIYDPSMCCPTGKCGANIDQEFLRVSAALYKLKKAGVEVHRYSLSTSLGEFKKCSAVNQYLHHHGTKNLPLIVLDNSIVMIGRYPTDEEFIEIVGRKGDINLNPSVWHE